MMQQAQPLVNLIITTGEPAGVGPEVSLAAAQDFLAEQPNANITLLGDASLLTIDPKIDASILERLNIEDSPLVSPVVAGVLNPANAPYVLSLLDHAVQACLQLHLVDARLHGDYPLAICAHCHRPNHFWHLPLAQLIRGGVPAIDLANRDI